MGDILVTFGGPSPITIDASPSPAPIVITSGGISSGGAAAYEHTQSVAVSEWIVNHNLGAERPLVSVYSVGGVEVDANVVDLPPNQVRIFFNSPTAGTARIRF